MDPCIMDIYTQVAEYVARSVSPEDIKNYFGDDLEQMSDEGLRKRFAEWLANDGWRDLVKWYLKVGKPNKETMARITTYALDLPELGVHATIQCTYDESTGNQWCEVTHVEFDDDIYDDWDDDIENFLKDLFHSL